MEKDIYDLEVERLTGASPDDIFNAWAYGDKHSPLFNVVGGGLTFNDDGDEEIYSGCLTQIRKFEDHAAFINGRPDLVLTEEIKKDERIPIDVEYINDTNLPVFAEWQRRIKKLEQERK